MNAKRRLAPILAAAALAGGLASPALAADSVTVQAQVSIDAPCLTVSTTSVDFGHNALSTDIDMTRVSRPFTFASCSAATEHVFGRATNASGDTSSWSLVASNEGCAILGPNQYQLYAHWLDPQGRDRRVPFLTTGIEMQPFLTAGATGLAGDLELWMPCTGSDGAGETMSFNLTLTASF